MEMVCRDGNANPKLSEKEARASPAKRQKDTIQWRDVLYDYSQASTIAGLSHITGDTPFKARRVIWTLLVITGCCIFVLQVVHSVLMYYSWPVTVNVKVNYNDTLVFPAVTICNQNSFRITQSVNHGYYELLTNAFASYHHEDKGGKDSKAHYDEESSKNHTRDAALHKLYETISMDDVYNQTSHTIEDMMISCQWDGRPCEPGDIVSVSTDHGACMTFNGGTTTDIKKVKRIGSNGGLRLRLNIEQYEYMSGPTEGAGIKIQLHDQKEIAMVRYLGQAIPPGAHALVGLSILQVGNLKPPHGLCNDDKKLQYYDHYSMSACLLDCRQKFLIRQCECRDVYMRPGKHNETVPVCTLNQYLTCLVKNLESDDANVEECGCPVPCTQTLFSPTITHATLSQFDQQKILLSDENLRAKLDRKHHQAREVRHRVDSDILLHDAARLRRFLAATNKLDSTFEHLKSMATNMTAKFKSMFSTWQTNYDFHRWGALNFMEYIIKYNYVRAWEIKDERTFRYMTFNFNDFLSNIEINFNELKRTANMTSPEVQAYRKVISWGIKKDLALRVAVTSRGLDNISSVHNAFRLKEVIANYQYTRIERYDSLYNPLCLKSHQLISQRNEQLFRDIRGRLETMIFGTLHGFEKISDEAIKGRPIDNVKLAMLSHDFLALSRMINYKLFLFKDRVVDFSLQETEALISRFDLLITNLEERKTEVNAELKSLETSIEKFLETYWKYVAEAKAISSQYLQDKSLKKSQLAEVILSENIQTSATELRKVVLDVRARWRNIKDINRGLKQAVFTVYYNIMTNTTGDSCTNTLYEYLRKETDRIREDRSILEAKGGDKVFQHLLKPLPLQGGQIMSAAEIKAMSADDLARITNADLPTLEEKEAQLEKVFSSFDNEFDFNKAIDTTDVDFTNILQDLREVLREYKATGEIDAGFLRDNILNVDVFLRELSYEEIQQQKAYSLTNLWSDIGGSLGLFVGASVLTVAELIDVVVHTLLRKHLKTSGHGKPWRHLAKHDICLWKHMKTS